jgi:hypothetical protein
MPLLDRLRRYFDDDDDRVDGRDLKAPDEPGSDDRLLLGLLILLAGTRAQAGSASEP